LTKQNWIPVLGDFDASQDGIILFQGGDTEFRDAQGNPFMGAKFGRCLSNQDFNEGSISVDITFSKISPESTCQIMLGFNQLTDEMTLIGFGTGMVSVDRYIDSKWSLFGSVGNKMNLKENKSYSLRVLIEGSRITAFVDEVKVLSTYLPYTLAKSQIGLWCRDTSNILISNIQVNAVKPKVFVIMQYSQPFDDLYTSVIKSVCQNGYGLEVVRADDTSRPGLIIADVINQIIESNLVIAEITPDNPNVFYEVGYAHAINKATILVASRDRKLPFDVSPFRTLFYENTIGGKEKIEDDLKRYLEAFGFSPIEAY
jgi:hypothetical protein